MTVDDSVVEFAQAAVGLANAVGYDLKQGSTISEHTVYALKTFMDAHDIFIKTLDEDEEKHII